jgi:hypothetical protein
MKGGMLKPCEMSDAKVIDFVFLKFFATNPVTLCPLA